MAFLRHSLRGTRNDYLDFSIAVGSKLESSSVPRVRGPCSPHQYACHPILSLMRLQSRHFRRQESASNKCKS